MRVFKSRFNHKLGMFLLALIIVFVSLFVIEKEFNVSPELSKLSKLPGEVAGIFLSNKFLPVADFAGAQVSSPYSNIAGDINVSGNMDITGTINATNYYKNGSLLTFTSQWINTGNAGSNIYFNTGNVGIGNTAPSASLQVNPPTGTNTEGVRVVSSSNWSPLAIMASDNTTTYFRVDQNGAVCIGADCRTTWPTGGIGSGGGSGTLNYVSKFTPSGTVLGNSRIYDNGTSVGIGTAGPSYPLEVAGDIYANGGSLHISGTNKGLVWESYGSNGLPGGLYMSDIYWIRTYGNNSIWTNGGLLATNGGLSSGYGGASPPLGGAIISGKVGIGNSSPASELQVNPSTGTEGIRVVSSNYSPLAIMASNNTTDYFRVKQDGNVCIGTDCRTAWPSALSQWTTSGNNIYYNTGNVGVGTANPGAPLELYGSNKAYIDWNETSFPSHWRWVARSDTGAFQVQDIANSGLTPFTVEKGALSSSLYVKSTGNIGIGTNSPVNKLDVNGDVALSGKHALRGNDAWLRLNQDLAFTSGVHTPGLLAPGSLNVGGANSWANPGAGKIIANSDITTSTQFCIGASCISTWPTGGIGSGGGSGNLNYVSKFTPNGTTIGNSQIFDNGNTVSIGTASPDGTKLQVNPPTSVEGVRIISSNYSPFVIRNAANSADFFRINENGFVCIGTDCRGAWPAQWATSGSNIYYNTGSVGIGTASPVAKLDIQGADPFTAISMGSAATTQYANLVWNSNSGTAQIWKAGTAYSSWGGASALNIYTSTGAIAFHPNNIQNAMYLSTGGNIGIGTASPSNPLTVRSNSMPIMIGGGAGYDRNFGGLSWDVTPRDSLALWGVADVSIWSGNGTKAMTISGGNVGIGTASPAYKLDVTAPAGWQAKFGPNSTTYVGISENQIAGFGGPFYINSTSTQNTLINQAGGNVGIGTVTPATKLNVVGGPLLLESGGVNTYGQIKGYNNNNHFITMRGIVNSDGSITAGHNQTFVEYLSPADSSTGWFFKNSSNGYTTIARISANNSYFSGSVGIGTASPAMKLHVSNGDSSYALFGPNTSWGSYLRVGAGTDPGHTSGYAGVISTNGNLHLDAGSTQSIYLGYYTASNTYINPNGGNVGINTTSPARKLEVNGGNYPMRLSDGAGHYMDAYIDSTWAEFNSNVSRFYVNTDMYIDGKLCLYANTSCLTDAPTSYGSFGVTRVKNGYYGLLIGQGTSNANIMYDGSGNGGIYYENSGLWEQYFLRSNNHLNIMTSSDLGATLGVSGTIRATGGITGSGGLYADNGSTIQSTAYNNNGYFAMNNASTYWGIMGNYGANDWRIGYGNTINLTGWNLRWDASGNAWANNSFGVGGSLSTGGSITSNRNWYYLAGAGDTNHAIGNISSDDGEQFRFWQYLDLYSPLGGGRVRISNNGTTNISAGGGTALQINNGGDLVITSQVSGGNTTFYNDYGTLGISSAIAVGGYITAGGIVSQQLAFNQMNPYGNEFYFRGAGNGGGSAGYLETYIGGNAYAVYAYYSSAKYKKNITDLEIDTSKIYNLQTRSYNDNHPGTQDKTRKFGMIAEEVQNILPQLVTPDEHGQPMSIDYAMLSVLELKEMQKNKVASDADLALIANPEKITISESSQVTGSNGNIITKISAFAKSFIGYLKAGVIETQKLIVNGVDILERLNTLTQKVNNQQQEIDALKIEIKHLQK